MWVMNVDKIDQDRGWSSMMRALLKFNEIDLFEVSQIQVNAMAFGDIPLFLEIRTDSAKGPVVGRKQLIKSTHGLDFQAQIIPISASRGKKDLYFKLSGISQPTKGSDIALEWFRFLRKGQKGI